MDEQSKEEIFMNYYLEALRNWKNFDGKASRREYWMFVLVNIGITFAISSLDSLLFSESRTLSGLYSLILLVPGISIATRRLHDIGKSGWWQLVGLIPVVGWIWLIILLAKDSE